MDNLRDNHAYQEDPWRVFRIMSEFVEGFEVMSRVGPAVSIFGSARTPSDHRYYQMARKLGAMLVDHDFAVITGGGMMAELCARLPGLRWAVAGDDDAAEEFDSAGLVVLLVNEAAPEVPDAIKFASWADLRLPLPKK